MLIRMLGPLHIHRTGLWIPVPAAKQRLLLALLLVHPGRTVARDQICETLWNGTQPASASRLLPHYAWRLRGLLPQVLAGNLRGTSMGYTLMAADEHVDHRIFSRLVSRAKTAAERSDLDGAIDDLTKALELWQGPALADARGMPVLEQAAQQLDRQRIQTSENLCDLLLATGRHEEALPVLEGLTAAEPFRERPWRALLLALHRAGRRHEALLAYRRLWRLWIDQLGIEPSHHIQVLQRRLLEDDPTLHTTG